MKELASQRMLWADDGESLSGMNGCDLSVRLEGGVWWSEERMEVVNATTRLVKRRSRTKGGYGR